LNAHILKNFMILAALFVSSSAFADAPLPPPAAWKTCDPSINFCAYMDPKNGTTVYKIDAPFSAKEMYRLPGWHRWARISQDGQFFITAYGGLNLVPHDVKPGQVMVTIWKNGAKHKEITLGQIIKKWSSLRETASHYYWGEITQLSQDRIYLKTVEGAVSIELETGVVGHS
jgi:hypothetical protein